MAEKPMNNFKTAVNELMNGKARADEDSVGGFDDDDTYAPEPTFTPFVPSAPGNTPSDMTSILSSDIIIEGTVKSKSDIHLNGYVKGDISCGGTILSSGTVDGNVESSNLTLEGSTINGNLNVRGAISIDSNSSITGDIIGSALHSDGKIKGNIISKESVALQSNAIVIGNIKAKSISIDPGTTVIGNLEIKASGFAASPEPAAAAPSPILDLLIDNENDDKQVKTEQKESIFNPEVSLD